MCEFVIQDKIDEILKDLTTQRKEFTAYEVTKLVRAEMPGRNIIHAEVRAEVLKRFLHGELGQYNRRMGGFKNVDTQPMVYYPISDPADQSIVVQDPKDDGMLDPGGSFIDNCYTLFNSLFGKKSG